MAQIADILACLERTGIIRGAIGGRAKPEEGDRNATQKECSDYTSRAEIILEDEPDITREKLAEEMDLPLDFIDDLLAQIRPTRISPKPVMNHQLGRFR